ncbi:hypothetical protein B0J17DRAFT_717200 [Rhizoctonia solani]|nr:hypothetical protein B0J17DRAFT_717200 [Rhizoctonia solani]
MGPGSKSRSNLTTSRRTGGQTSIYSSNDKSKVSSSKNHSSRNLRQMGQATNLRSAKNFSKGPVWPHNPHSQSVCSPTPTKGYKASVLKSPTQPMTKDGQMALQGGEMSSGPPLISSLKGNPMIHPTNELSQEDYVDCAEYYSEVVDLSKRSPGPPLNQRAKSLANLWVGKVKQIVIDVRFGQERRNEPYYPPKRRLVEEEDEEESEEEEEHEQEQEEQEVVVQEVVEEGTEESNKLRDATLQSIFDIPGLTNMFPDISLV